MIAGKRDRKGQQATKPKTQSRASQTGVKRLKGCEVMTLVIRATPHTNAIVRVANRYQTVKRLMTRERKNGRKEIGQSVSKQRNGHTTRTFLRRKTKERPRPATSRHCKTASFLGEHTRFLPRLAGCPSKRGPFTLLTYNQPGPPILIATIVTRTKIPYGGDATHAQCAISTSPESTKGGKHRTSVRCQMARVEGTVQKQIPRLLTKTLQARFIPSNPNQNGCF